MFIISISLVAYNREDESDHWSLGMKIRTMIQTDEPQHQEKSTLYNFSILVVVDDGCDSCYSS